MLYPIGIQNFEKIIKGGFAYVDKTDLVYDLIVLFSEQTTPIREKSPCLHH